MLLQYGEKCDSQLNRTDFVLVVGLSLDASCCLSEANKLFYPAFELRGGDGLGPRLGGSTLTELSELSRSKMLTGLSLGLPLTASNSLP